MNLCILTQYYPPEMGAPQARLSDLARRLHRSGNGVTVLTAMPNYPTGTLFDGYPHFYMKEVKDGVDIYRSWIVPSNRPSLLHRLLSYLSFCLSALITGAMRIGKMDILITESPPLFLAVAGWLLARIKGARWILNISDLWPDSAKHIGMWEEQSILYRAMLKLAHFLYRRAWLVTGQSKEIISEISRQVPSARVYHFSNGVDTSVFCPGRRSDEIRQGYLKPGEVGFVYAGLHGLFQGLQQVIMAADRLRQDPVRFVFLGDGPEKDSLRKKVLELGLTNVDFYPPVPHEHITSILSSMDVALVPLKSAIQGAVPSKIYEAMASGIPILLVAVGEAREVVLKANAGIAVSPGDLDGFTHAVRELAFRPELRKEMGKAGRFAAEHLYDRSRIIERFEAQLHQ